MVNGLCLLVCGLCILAFLVSSEARIVYLSPCEIMIPLKRRRIHIDLSALLPGPQSDFFSQSERVTMSCHVCGHTMQLIGVADRIHWCTRCGSIKRKLRSHPNATTGVSEWTTEEVATILPERVREYLIAIYGAKRENDLPRAMRAFVAILESVAINSDELDTLKPPFDFLHADAIQRDGNTFAAPVALGLTIDPRE